MIKTLLRRPFSRLPPLPETPHFPSLETQILRFWERTRAFPRQLEKSQNLPKYTFYDGPPFATGLPHYGHIAAGTIKDVVTRYASQTGHHVPRRFGWDCHGLPVEHEIDKQLGIRTQADFDRVGLKAYNEACRAIVLKYASEWKDIVWRFGRWIEFDNAYKTMDRSYMESVWWVLKRLFQQGRIFRSARVMPYSPTCATVLSNFEANLNYKDVQDPSILVSFPLVSGEANFLVWTTTPWTLPCNLMLAVNPNERYCHVEIDSKLYILMEKRLEQVGSWLKRELSPQRSFLGAELLGAKYKPPFGYFKSEQFQRAFEVLAGDFVTSESGTGIVHCAPAFGEDDFELCKKEGVMRDGMLREGAIPPSLLDNHGCFDIEDDPLKDIYFKDADKLITQRLKKAGLLVYQGTIQHSYPFCWRSDKPLIYKACPSWFVRIDDDLRARLLRNNLKAQWVPKHAQEKRFQNWLENAKDWCFSRNRYWGNPIPIWTDQDYKVVECIGSVDELKAKAGIRSDLQDIHRDKIDGFVIPKNGKFLRRVPEVFDCWFESGAMPYASAHYPFSTNQQQFNQIFPADFIGEGLDQTRGWFYTLNVLASALKDSEPYKHLIVNGLVLAEDGKKMSKRLQNYPDPMSVVEKHGADAIRLYLVNSGLSHAEPLNFSEKGVREVVKQVLLPWHNSLRFLSQNWTRYLQDNPGKSLDAPGELGMLDEWITQRTGELIKYFQAEMGAYRLYSIAAELVAYLDQLTNWYIRLNRGRLRGSAGEEEARTALLVLHEALYSFSLLISCFTPFYAEEAYQHLEALRPIGREESVHHVLLSSLKAKPADSQLLQSVALFQDIVQTGRMIRDRCGISLKQPLPRARVLGDLKLEAQLQEFAKDELNILELEFEDNEASYVHYEVKPHFQAIKEEFPQDKKAMKALIGSIRKGELEGVEEHFLLRTKTPKQKKPAFAVSGAFSLQLDTEITPELERRRELRELVKSVQQWRKAAKLKVEDRLELVVVEQSKSKSKGTLPKEDLGRGVKAQVVEGSASAGDLLGEVKGEYDGAEVRVQLHRSRSSYQNK